MLKLHHIDHLGQPIVLGSVAALYYPDLYQEGSHVLINSALDEQEKEFVIGLIETHHIESPGAMRAITRDELEDAKEKAPHCLGTVESSGKPNHLSYQ